MNNLESYIKEVSDEYEMLSQLMEEKSEEIINPSPFSHWFLNGEINEKVKALLSMENSSKFNLSNEDFRKAHKIVSHKHSDLMMKFYEFIDKKRANTQNI